MVCVDKVISVIILHIRLSCSSNKQLDVGLNSTILHNRNHCSHGDQCVSKESNNICMHTKKCGGKFWIFTNEHKGRAQPQNATQGS